MRSSFLGYLLMPALALLLAAGCDDGCFDGEDDDEDEDDEDDAGDDDVDDDDADDDDAECPEPTLDITVCDPSNGPFSLTIDNEFFPLAVGTELVLEGQDDEGVTIRVEITVLDETKDIAGVTTRVVQEAEYEDGDLVEISDNWFAQAPDGTVCYFGERTDIYVDGVVVSHAGSWQADGASQFAGIIMPGAPQVGDVYFQEFAEGIAEDMSETVALGESITVPAGTFTDTLSAFDFSPLDGCGVGDEKTYASGIGLAIDEDVELISYTIP